MKNFWIVLMVLAFASCNQGADMQFEASTDNGGMEISNEKMRSAESEESIVEQDNLNSDIQRKLIKTGNIEFETLDLLEVDSRIRELAQKHKAYISNENEYKSARRLSRSVTLRIPAEHFDVLLAELSEGVDHFDSRSIQVSDVTEEFLDITARLKTKKELEARYLDLLKKATKVSEILEIEREIGNLRASIESIEGRLKFLNDQVSMSTLHIRYYKSVATQSNFWWNVKQGISNGWDYLKMFLIGLVNIWPFILIIATLLWYIRRVWRRNRAQRTGSK